MNNLNYMNALTGQRAETASNEPSKKTWAQLVGRKVSKDVPEQSPKSSSTNNSFSTPTKVFLEKGLASPNQIPNANELGRPSITSISKHMTSEQTLRSLEKSLEERTKERNLTRVFRPLGGASEICPNQKEPQYVNIKCVANQILFSQQRISDFIGDQTCSLEDFANELFKSFKKEGAIDIVCMDKDQYTSLDNRRLFIAKRIAFQVPDSRYGIWVRVHGIDEALSPPNLRRFLGAVTWGQAVLMRVNNLREGHIDYISKPGIGFPNEPLLDRKCISRGLSIMIELDLRDLNPADLKKIREKVQGNCILI